MVNLWKVHPNPLQDDSPIKDVVAPIKRKYTRRCQLSKKNDKDSNDVWSPEKEKVLCKAWVDVIENSIEGNAKKANRFWTEVVTYFEKEMGKRKEATILSTINGKIRFVLKLVNFVRFTIASKGGTRVEHRACDNTI